MSSTPSPNLREKFINGLAQLDPPITVEEILKNFKYCGGYCLKCHNGTHTGDCNNRRHMNYYKLNYPKDKYLPFDTECVCGHALTVCNCYLVDKEDNLLIIGNCCVDTFLGDIKQRTCEVCGTGHKRRTINRCYDCEKLLNKCAVCKKWCENDLCGDHISSVKCLLCRSYHNTGNKKCFNCHGKCLICHKPSKEYDFCYNCRLSSKCRKCNKLIDPKYSLCFKCK
jgi:hypothetical protein